MNPVDPVRDNVIYVSEDNVALYITPLKYKLGILETNPNINEIEIQDWAKRAISGDDFDYLLFPFLQGKLTTDWWNYIVEHKKQFLNKEIVFNVMNKMKHLYKDISYDKDIRKVFDRSLTYKFFNLYDFCIQALSTGDYYPKNVVDIYSSLEDEDLYKLMQNHLNVIETNFVTSRLQDESQKDVINHIINHVILSYYEWQGWISQK